MARYRKTRDHKKKHSARSRRPGGRGGLLRGRLIRHPRGFGFVATTDGGPDVFVPGHAMGGALHGDFVEVQASPSPKGRDGFLVSIQKRGTTLLTGVLQRSNHSLWLVPDDPRLVGPMPVHEDAQLNEKPGQTVVAQIVRYPTTPSEPPEVKIIRALGPSGTKEVEVEKIKIRENVTEEFPDEVLDEAGALSSRIPPEEQSKRVDLRDVDLVTIDPEDARDHDDAVWGERTPDGDIRIIIAIADVSHYVKEGGALDREALGRGCSIYLPDRAIPMLPRELSSDLASLLPGQERLCLAIEVFLKPNGAIRKHRYFEAVMKSGARLTYGGVARALGFDVETSNEEEARARSSMLGVLFEATRLLRKRRERRGSLEFDLPEARIRLDEEGNPADVYIARKDPGLRQAYGLIEDLMLLANELVAKDLSKKRISTIFRVHGSPDEEKISIFAELAGTLGYEFDSESASRPKSLAQFLKTIEGKPRAQVLHFLLLRAMQQATYSIENIGHFGLAAQHYLHFTSPIRRYPDLIVHRIVKSFLRGEHRELKKRSSLLSTQALESSRLERRAMIVERDVLNLYGALLMRDRIGDEFDATITLVTERGFLSALDAPYVEVFTPLDRLGEHFELDRLGIRLYGLQTGRAYVLGERVRVRLEEVNVGTRALIAFPTDIRLRAEQESSHRHKHPAKHPKRNAAENHKSPRGRRPRSSRDIRR